MAFLSYLVAFLTLIHSCSLARHKRHMNAFKYSIHGLEGFPEVPFLACFFFNVRNVGGSTQSSESEHHKAHYVECPGVSSSQA